ncbi:MAG: hypothetical protein ACREQM_02705 [Candidatus Dormibacteraceae bacterium]
MNRQAHSVSLADFRRWLREVDEQTYRLAGLFIHDLPDQPFRDSGEAGVSSRSFVEEALLDEGFPFEGES